MQNFDFRRLFGSMNRINVMDVGAAVLAETPVYKALLDGDLAHLNAFEGDSRQIERIREAYGARVSVFPDFLFDGTIQTLYVAPDASGMTSLFKPKQKALRFFNGFELFGHTEKTVQVETKRLDDVAHVPPIDFAKLDIQGSELTVLRNGLRILEKCVAIQLEVSYICLYEQQPAFGEVDVWMRQHGFAPHCFLDVKKWSIAPTVRDNNFRIPFNQLLESDIVYIRDPLELGVLNEQQLMKLAVIAHCCFASTDLCVHLLRELIDRGCLPAGAYGDYLRLVNTPG